LEPLLLTFVAALAAEWGDKTQLLVVAFGARYRRPLPVIAGVAVGALLNALLSAFGGHLLHGYVTPRAVSLIVGMALVFAGGGAFLRARTPDMGGSWRVGPFLTTAACFFLLEFGDKTQFVTAAFGATAGIILSSVPAALLGGRFADAVPLRAIRIAVGSVLLLAGLAVGLSALRLA
jgi:putative Ca2+/H+ antiporter (TMEM165/GDT1 family)